MWWMIGQIALCVLGLYILTACVFLVTARIKKDADETLILIPNSWHFKATFPIMRLSRYRIKELSGRIGLCGYFCKFFLMLFVGWPIIAVGALLKTIVYSPFMLLFGYFPIADLNSVVEADYLPLLAVRVKKIPLPRIQGFKLFPAYAALPFGYVACWLLWPGITLAVTRAILVFIGVIAVFIGLLIVLSRVRNWYKKTDSELVILVKEWVTAKTRRLCPLIKIRSA